MDFLKAITASEACRILDTFSLSPRTETVHIDNAYARVLARDIVSSESIPAFARSLVDGYAVRSRDTQGATETNPLFLIRTGAVCLCKHRLHDAFWVERRCHAGIRPSGYGRRRDNENGL